MKKKLILKFSHGLVDSPIVYKLIKDYNLIFNILKASITPNEEGFMVLELSGETADFKKGMEYLTKSGVITDSLEKEITRIENKCTHCGACLSVCPTCALSIDKNTREIKFNKKDCIACDLCLKICPARAMKAHSEI